MSAAIILAAGESRRMGRPKALLPFRDGTFLSVLARTLGEYCSPVIGVFGAKAELLASHAPPGMLCVVNRNYKFGMLTSLQAGLGALPREARDSVIFTLVDHPAVRRETVRALIASSAPIAIPRFQGKRGHPVALRGGIIDEIASEAATSRTSDVIARHAAEIEYIDLPDPGICDDIDEPMNYRELMAREARTA